jgi:hypothetical protein
VDPPSTAKVTGFVKSAILRSARVGLTTQPPLLKSDAPEAFGMSNRRLPQKTDTDTAEASNSPSLAKRSPKSKGRKLVASPSALTPKRALGHKQLSDIVDAIVDELRPYRRPKKDVQESVRFCLERLPTEVAQLQARLGVIIKESSTDALRHLKELGKCAAELTKLLFTMPRRIAWVADVRSAPFGFSYPMSPKTSILIPAPVEDPGREFSNFISNLERLQTAAKIAERYVGPSPLYEADKHLSARYARLLIVALSTKSPASGGTFRTIAGLLFEVITGEKDVNLERHCKAELKAAAGPK